MTFLITLIALLMERFFHWHHLRQWRWFFRYEQWLADHIDRFSAWIRLAINVMPPVLLVGLISCLLTGWFYDIFKFIFSVVVLLYCLGPENLWVQVYQSMNSQESHQHHVEEIFIAAQQRIFSVIFWFVLLGPMGAVLYRLIALFSEKKELNLLEPAAKSQSVLDWLPVRIFTFLFALGGHFVEVFDCWKKKVFLGLDYNQALLVECGMAALDVMENGQVSETSEAEKEALKLIDRVFVIAMVILAAIVIIF